MSETLPLSSVKAHLSELVDRVEDQHDRVVVTRNGKPAAVLVSPEDLESLEETLAILSDPLAMEQIRKSERSHAAARRPPRSPRSGRSSRPPARRCYVSENKRPQVTSTANVVRLPPMLGKMMNVR